MKHLYLSFILLFFSVAVIAQDYYWVGDGGNWSDLSHWATTSGGNTTHSQLPGPENDVFFDENSFSEAGQVVTIDLEDSYCRNLEVNNVQFAPAINGQGFYDVLQVHGHLLLSNNMDYGFRMIYMMGEGTVQIVTGESFIANFLELSGGGVYHLNDSLACNNLYVNDGVFYSNDNPIYTGQRIYGYAGNSTIYLGTSNVYTKLWFMSEQSNLFADEATIYYGSTDNIFNDFKGGGQHYHRVVFEGLVELEHSNSFDFFEAVPGANIQLEAGSTQSAETFVLQGTSVQPIYLSSLTSGAQAFLFKASGTVEAAYLVLQDNGATGGANFDAEESIDLGNNTGWNISISVPMDYYWVGGSGNWSDASHWATTSGGNTFHDDPPSALDNVFFDSNSALQEGDIVALEDLNWSCFHFSTSGINASAQITQTAGGQLNVYGNFTSDSDVLLNLRRVNMEAEEPANIHILNAHMGSNCELNINTISTLNVQSALNVRVLNINSGEVLTNSNDIDVTFSLNISSPDASADLSGSVLNVRIFNNHSSVGQFNVDNTIITCSGAFHSNGQDYHHLTLNGPQGGSIQPVYNNFYAEQLTIAAGAKLEIESGTTITTNEMEILGTAADTVYIQSSDPGSEMYFQQSSGQVNAYYMKIQDNHATGGATFNAYESDLLDNVVGWNLVTSVHDSSQSESQIAFPNPANQYVKIDALQGDQFRLIDLSGREVMVTTMQQGLNSLNVEHLPAGVYLLQIAGANHRTERLVIQ